MAKLKTTTQPPQLVKRITITVRGVEENDLDLAIAEATRLVREGYYSGHNSNDTGAFYFETTYDVPKGEEPA